MKKSSNPFFAKEKILFLTLFMAIMVAVFVISALTASKTVNAESSILDMENNTHDASDNIENSEVNSPNNDENDILDIESVKNTAVLFEDINKRNATEKHFRLRNGSYIANIFSYDIHFLENNQYVEIDNRLIKDADGKYKNQKNKFQVELPQSYQIGEKSKISVGDYSLSFNLLNQKVNTNQETTIDNITDSKFLNVDSDYKYDIHAQSKIRYYFENSVELEYLLIGTALKENIIINNPLATYLFEFEITTDNLKLELTQSGSVNAIDEKGNSIFAIPKGYMYDSANELSNNIKYELVQHDRKYILRIIPDNKWLNDSERVFPITIDPSITITDSSQFKSANTGGSTNGSMAANTSAFSFIDFTLPSSLRKAVVLSATMKLFIRTYSNSVILQIWENANEFEDDEPPTDETLPYSDGNGNDIYANYYYNPNNTIEPYDKKVLAANPYAINYTQLNIDITESLKNALDFETDNEFHGYAFNTASGNLVIVNEDYSNTNWLPIVEVYYRNIVGLETYWDYDHYSIGNDDIYINTYNDESTITHTDAIIDGTNPIILQHVYMDNYSDANFNVDNVFTNFYLGKGWKLNYQQIIRHRNVYDFEYYDADGTLHYFYYNSTLSAEMGQNVASDEDGLGLKLYTVGNSFKMIDLNNDEMWFDYHGRLFKTVDRNNNIVNIIYGNGNQSTVSQIPITEINDNNSHSISFTYSNGYLTSLTYKRADGVTTATTSFTYSDNKLSRITNDDGTYSQYGYEDIMQYITNESGYTLKFTTDRTGVPVLGLSSVPKLFKPETAKVRSIYHDFDLNSSSDDVHIQDNIYCHGLTISATPNGDEPYVPFNSIDAYNHAVQDPLQDIANLISNTNNEAVIVALMTWMIVLAAVLPYTEVEPYMEDCQPYFSSNYRIKKSYDVFGRLVSAYADDISAMAIDTDYEMASSNGINNNKKIESSSSISSIVSYGRNMSFENRLYYWTVSNENSPYRKAQISSQFASHGKFSLEMFVASPSTFSITQDEPLIYTSGQYTVAASIRVENVLIPGVSGNAYGAYIYLADTLGNIYGRSEYITTSISTENDGFIDISFMCTLENPSGVTIGLAMDNCAGLVYFDKIRLAPTPNGMDVSNNNIANGAFIRSGNWNFNYTSNNHSFQYVDGDVPNSKLYAKLYNDGSGSVYIYQTVPLDHVSSDNYYNLSAWFERFGRYYTHSEDAYIGLKYILLDENYSSLSTGFEYKTIDLPFETWYKLSSTIAVPKEARYIEIHIVLYYIEGTILIDNVSFVRAEAAKYDYDTFGNNNYYSDGKNVFEYNAEGTEAASIEINGIDKYGITKDSHGNVISSVDLTRKVKMGYTYDTSGRETSSIYSTLDNSYKIGTTTSYDLISNNLIESVTTSDSLGFQTISNAYAYSGLLKRTTFNDGTYVEYDYGEGNGFTSLPAVITVYTKDGNGTTLNAMTYNYYTMADLLASSSPLCIHIGALKSVVMPNNTTYSYQYDKWGNILEVKLNGVQQISYVYDTYGNVSSKSLANGYTETYEYDALYRLVRVEGAVNNTITMSYSYEYSAVGNLVALYDELNTTCYKYIYDESGRSSRYLHGNYQVIDTYKLPVFDYINEIQYSAYGEVQKNINMEATTPSYFFVCTNTSNSGALTRTRAGLTETVAIGGTTQITYTYNSPSKEYGRIIVEDNKLIKNTSYPNGVRFTYTRDLDGNITGITISQYGTSANGVTYNAPYRFHTDSYEFDNGNVNLWDYDWMALNQPSGASVSIEKIEGEEEYNGVIIKDIIRLHQGSFYANNNYYSLVDTAALQSGIKGDKITFWAKMMSIPNGVVYAPCLVYSDGSLSPYQAFAMNTDWQFFSITVDKNKTAVSLRLPWYNAVWLEIGNMSIYAEKNVWDTQWSLSNVVNAGAQALPQERISSTDIVTNIIKVHQSTFFEGSQGGIEVYRSLVDPNLLANGGDCITLTYRARIDTLDSNWLNNYSQDVLNTRIRALRFRYSDNTFDYGSQPNIAYSTNWQSFSITSAPGKKVVGIELGYNYGSWVRIGNVRITAQNLGRLDDRLTGQTLFNNNYICYDYDLLGREIGVEIKSQKHTTTSILAETYTYLDGTIANGETNTSYTVTSKAIQYGNSNGIVYNYTYCMDNPALGSVKSQRSNPYNIWQIKEGSNVKVTYNYDLLGRLVREDNAYVNATITYTYDSNNNILSKTNYAYSPNTATLNLSGGTTVSYTYDSTYGDRLTSYDGQTITYDSLGNPTYYFGKSMSWNGRQLSSLTSNGVAKYYSYDANGMRSSKTVGSVITEYLYNDKQLIREIKGDNTIYYLYNQNGMVGLELNGTPYYYVRNLQGDVTKILNASGSIVVQYVYDSWGKMLSITGSLANTVGAKNPIRYRGYYYDTETALYYLNSRYYDPETGRFISPDIVAEGGNLYTYCLNDPINRSDESGYLSKTWKSIIHITVAVVIIAAAVAITIGSGGTATPVLVGAAIGLLISGGLSITQQLCETGQVDMLKTVVDATTGAAFGAFGGSTLGVMGMAIASGTISTLSSISNDWIDGQNIDYGKALVNGVTGALIGCIGGAGAQHGLTGQRIAALNVRSQIKTKYLRGGYKSKNNYVFGLKSNANRITRVTKELKQVAFKNLFRSVKATFEPTVYQYILFG